MRILRTADIQLLDRRTAEAGITSLDLMERAGRGCAEAIMRRIARISRRDIHVFCGKGNNGGDGLVVARYLAEEGCRVRIYCTHSASESSPENRANREKLPDTVKLVDLQNSRDLPAFSTLLAPEDLVIDALLGVGIVGGLKEPYRSLIAELHAWPGEVVAIDVPSGVGEDNGQNTTPAMRADLTLTIGIPKVGLFLEPATYQVGEIEIIPLEYPAELLALTDSSLEILDPVSVGAELVERRPAGHKSTYGRLLIIGGSRGMAGSVALAAEAALRAGAGMVTVATAASAQPVAAASMRELMTVALPETAAGVIAPQAIRELLPWLDWATTVVLGPGLTMSPAARGLVSTVLDHWEGPLVLDADGLKIAGVHLDRLRGRAVPAVCTPHLGEASALLGIPTEDIQRRRLDVSLEAARTHQLVFLLKGYRTVIASPEGKASVSTVGSPGLATAGTGDVLSGIIGAELAQGLDPYRAACVGTYLHGEAGEFAAQDHGAISMTAGDVIRALPAAIQQIQRMGQGLD